MQVTPIGGIVALALAPRPGGHARGRSPRGQELPPPPPELVTIYGHTIKKMGCLLFPGAGICSVATKWPAGRKQHSCRPGPPSPPPLRCKKICRHVSGRPRAPPAMVTMVCGSLYGNGPPRIQWPTHSPAAVFTPVFHVNPCPFRAFHLYKLVPVIWFPFLFCASNWSAN